VGIRNFSGAIPGAGDKWIFPMLEYLKSPATSRSGYWALKSQMVGTSLLSIYLKNCSTPWKDILRFFRRPALASFPFAPTYLAVYPLKDEF
jgi:hypothetical protein